MQANLDNQGRFMAPVTSVVKLVTKLIDVHEILRKRVVNYVAKQDYVADNVSMLF